jgi:hypothetical protein
MYAQYVQSHHVYDIEIIMGYKTIYIYIYCEIQARAQIWVRKSRFYFVLLFLINKQYENIWLRLAVATTK